MDSWSFSRARQNFGVAPARSRSTTRSRRDSAATTGEPPAASSDDMSSDARCLFDRGENTSQTQRHVLQLPAADNFLECKAHLIAQRHSCKQWSRTASVVGERMPDKAKALMLSMRCTTRSERSTPSVVASRPRHRKRQRACHRRGKPKESQSNASSQSGSHS